MRSPGNSDPDNQRAFGCPAERWDRNAAARALDDLFRNTILYRSSNAYRNLLDFVGKFRRYSPLNALLVHIQKPGAVFVAPPERWLHEYGRIVKPGARPLVILQPRGPAMFVFDLSDTDGEPFPPELENMFEVEGWPPTGRLAQLIGNCPRDGVLVVSASMGSAQAASLGPPPEGLRMAVRFGESWIPVRYVVEVSQNLDDGARYAALVHELAHLYCGHLGTPDPDWWPDRRLPEAIREFEAESAAYIVCRRAKTKSEQYLAAYLGGNPEVPPISLYGVMRAAGLIEEMSLRRLPPREKERKGRSRQQSR